MSKGSGWGLYAQDGTPDHDEDQFVKNQAPPRIKAPLPRGKRGAGSTSNDKNKKNFFDDVYEFKYYSTDNLNILRALLRG